MGQGFLTLKIINMQQPTPALLKAFAHVKEHHPTVAIVIFNKYGQHNYMDENFKQFIFDENIDNSLLEEASDSLTELPYIYHE